MEDMISKIIEMDRKAQGLSDEAQQSRADYESEILRTKEKIKSDYLERAKERIRINRQAAQKKTDEQLQVIRERSAAAISSLEAMEESRHEEWVQAIFDRVIGN